MYTLLIFQGRPSAIGSRLAEKKGAVAPWAESPEPERKYSPLKEIDSSLKKTWKEQSEPNRSGRKDFQFVDNDEEYQPTYRKDFVRKEPSPPKSTTRNGGAGLTPWSLVGGDKSKEDKLKSVAPQIDERANQFGSLLRNFQSGAKSKDSEPAQSNSAVGKIKVASIFDKSDPLEEEEKERKSSSMRNKGTGRARESLPPPLSSISSSSVRTNNTYKHEGDLRPHVLKKRQWQKQLKKEPDHTDSNEVTIFSILYGLLHKPVSTLP